MFRCIITDRPMVVFFIYTLPATPETPIEKFWSEFKEFWGLIALCKMYIQVHNSSMK